MTLDENEQEISSNSPLESLNSLNSKKLKGKKFNSSKTTKKIEKKEYVTDMSVRYQIAWRIIYNKQTECRKKEIDKEMECGTLGPGRWNEDFIQQVASLAESTSPLEAEKGE